MTTIPHHEVAKVAAESHDASRSAADAIDYSALYDNPIDYRNTYIITLKRDTLRVEHVTNLTRDTWPGAKIWWAIDGKNVTDTDIKQWRDEGYLAKKMTGFMNPKSKIGKPKISCLMSHVRVWEQLAAEEDPNAFYFILEDDVVATGGWDAHYTGVVKDLKGLAWDWVYLAIHPTFKRYNKLVIEGKYFINAAPRMVGNAGYLLSKQGAIKLLKHMLPCSLPKDQAVRVLVMDRTLDAYIVKTELVGVVGQQGQGWKGSKTNQEDARRFQSNIWPD
jgi:GR25 family glycosyltransferase involved in LPS biosynthesis